MDKSNEAVNLNTENTTGRDKNILLIDDDDTTCILIEEILSGFHFKITTVNNGKKAIEYIERKKNIDLIIMDIKLPNMDGFDLLKKIKTTHPSIPVIVHTALVNNEIKDICLNSGYSEFIEKPIDIDFFLSVINKYSG